MLLSATRKKIVCVQEMGRSSITSWGPAAWTLLHTISFAYPEDPSNEEKGKVFRFMHSFAEVLPCRRCREDWMQFLRIHMPVAECVHLTSKAAFSRFVVKGHNYVNQKLGKPVVAYETVERWYSLSYNLICPKLSTVLCVVAIIVVIVSCILRRRHTARLS